MKKMISMHIALCLMASSMVHAAITERTGSHKKSYEYSKAGDFGIEIYNKSGKQIWYAIQNGNESSSLFTSRPISGTSVAKYYTADLGKDTILALWFTEPQDFKPKGFLSFNKEWGFNPDPDKVFSFTKGKTIYVTVDSSQNVRPETGPLMGLMKKTQSNFSLKNNVESEDIKSVK
ncbi:hypothetical protein H0X06_00180 [Candidatus Dependentiae bacterium]|nr:hypothetical protein [Candidatus Dependentiae bacterium]